MEILCTGTIFKEFWAIRPKLYGNRAFPQNPHIRKLDEILVFYVVLKITLTSLEIEILLDVYFKWYYLV